jgi:hypothetical protein
VALQEINDYIYNHDCTKCSSYKTCNEIASRNDGTQIKCIFYGGLIANANNKDTDVIRGRRLTDLESHIFNEWQDLNCGVNDKVIDEVLKPFIINKPAKDKWFELLCFYHYQTEIYDRSLTDLRSPLDPTEAYTADPDIRRLSNQNAINTKNLINNIAGIEHIEITKNRYNYLSAQGWINEYIALKEQGELDWLEKYLTQ